MTSQQESTEQFSDRLMGFIGPSLFACGITVGNKLKLFDMLLDSDVPLTSGQIADKGNFKERYIREWLSLMAIGRIVDFANTVKADDLSSQTFTIPASRRAVLHSEVNSSDAVYMLEVVPLCAAVRNDLLEVMRKDGPRGISYDEYPDFHEWRNDLNKKKNMNINTFEDLEDIDGIIEKLEKGINILEPGCSTGLTTIAMAQRFPNSIFYGFDISKEAIESAEKNASGKSLSNLKFSVNDACEMPSEWSSKFDLVICWDVIHDVPRSDVALLQVSRVLKRGGVVTVIEPRISSAPKLNMDNPLAPYYYGVSLFHCVPVSTHFDGGLGLGASCGKESLTRLFKDAGFDNIVIKDVLNKSHYNYILRRSIDDN